MRVMEPMEPRVRYPKQIESNTYSISIFVELLPGRWWSRQLLTPGMYPPVFSAADPLAVDQWC